MKARNISVDILKLVLALFIALWHFGVWKPLSGTMIVDWFFLISGYFLFKKFYSDSEEKTNAFEYTKIKAKSIFPYYVTSLIVMFFALNIKTFWYNPKGFLGEAIDIIPEFFLVQSIGVFHGGINYPLWYLSALLCVSFLIFSLLKWNKRLVEGFIAPISAILVYTYITAVNMNEDALFSTKFGCLYIPLVRAWGSVCLGIALYQLINNVQVLIGKMKTFVKTILFVFCIALLFFLRANILSLFPFVFIFSFCLNNKKSYFSETSVFSFDKLSLSVYCNHTFVILITVKHLNLKQSNLPIAIVVIIYLITVLSYSALMLFLIDRLKPYVILLKKAIIKKS